MELIETGVHPVIGSIPDIRPLLGLREGAVLEGTDIVSISESLREMARLRGILGQRPSLADLAYKMEDHTPLCARIEALLLPTGEVADAANPYLGELRGRARALRVRILERMQAILERLKRVGAVMEDLVTLRNDRYVLPLRLDYTAHIKGITHDYSRTRQTAYVEPMELVDDNNALNHLRAEIVHEETRIYRELSALICQQAPCIRADLKRYALCDLMHACARWALQAGCAPLPSQAGEISLKGARHPILLEHLGRSQTVALDIHIPAGSNCLIISGPNAGGKTVALKTLGLFVLMAKSGLPVPADPSSRIPPLGTVWVEMDPGQDLGRDLSSFTSHACSLKRIYEEVAPGDLVLLDEPGSGTDYDQGGALAVACIEGLRSKGAWVALTSHSHLIKLFALSSSGVQYAATVFDEIGLKPRYALEYGVIGSSHAFEVLQSIHFPEELLQEAHSILSGHSESPLFRAMEDVAQTQAMRQQAEEELQKALELHRRLQEEAARIRKQRLDEALRYQRLMQKMERLSCKPRPQRVLEALRQDPAARELQESLEQPGLQQALELHDGALVRIRGSQATGRVVGLRGSSAEVLCGAKRLRVGLEALEAVSDAPSTDSHSTHGHPTTDRAADGRAAAGRSRARSPQRRAPGGESPERRSPRRRDGGMTAYPLVLPVTVSGLRVDEALPVVERALDRALLSGQERLEIIHGSGTGALRQAIRLRLSELPYVASLADEAVEHGGAAKTIVRLKGHG